MTSITEEEIEEELHAEMKEGENQKERKERTK